MNHLKCSSSDCSFKSFMVADNLILILIIDNIVSKLTCSESAQSFNISSSCFFKSLFLSTNNNLKSLKPDEFNLFLLSNCCNLLKKSIFKLTPNLVVRSFYLFYYIQ